MKKVLNKKLDEKAMLAGIFTFTSLGILYLFVSAIVNNTQAPTVEMLAVMPETVQPQNTEAAASGMKKYRSNFMKVEFSYPDLYSVIGNINDISIINGNSKIYFSKYGTNYDSSLNHTNGLIAKWTDEPNEVKPFEGGHVKDGILIKRSVNGVNYDLIIFVKDYSVYQFETSNPSLFQDLETIAKSLKILE